MQDPMGLVHVVDERTIALAERPGNLMFLVGSVVKESPLRPLTRPMGLGAGFAAGVAGTLAWRTFKSR